MSLPCFNNFRYLFYIDLEGKTQKIIPSNISYFITPVSLAFWIMSDGFYSKRDGYVSLCSDDFLHEDTKILMDILQNKFKFKCRTETKGKGLRIIIKKESLPELQLLIQDYVIPSMQYKIGLNLDYKF